MDVNYDVMVVGAGPIGLMLACELRTAGVHVLVVERRNDPDATVKAEGVNAATVAAFERRGLLPELQAFGRPFTNDGKGTADGRPPFAGHFGGIQIPSGLVDDDDPVLRHTGRSGWAPLQVPQVEVERILERRALALGVEVRRGVELVGFAADESGVTCALDGVQVRTGWLVGCDGGRSLVRRLAGFDFVGTGPELVGRQGVFEVVGADALPLGWQYTPNGLYVSGPAPGRLRTFEFDGGQTDRDAPVTAAEMEASVRRVSGVDVRITGIVSAARFTDHARQATTYRKGRVLLCGDAAHVHPPFSGQGLNLGIGDAVNLGWKLAATVHGWAPDGLLDTYTGERHPVGAAVLDWTRAQVAVMRGDRASEAAREFVTDLLNTHDGATLYVKRASGLGVRYELDDDHPLVGTLAPAVEHVAAGRALLVGSEAVLARARRYEDRLDVVRSSDTALLVRPDGVVAWAGEGSLEAALMRWLGAPTP